MPRECRVYAKEVPATQWGWDEILANKTNYLLETLVWMKTKDASKKFPQNKPDMWMPEFMPAAPRDIAEGSESHTTEDIAAILAQPRG